MSPFLVSSLKNCRESACVVEVVHVSAACRCEVAEVRHFRAEFVENIQVQLYAGFVCDSQQMEHAV